ncbi:nucleobase:cation symporter-2 family protein [Leekyejoonella antrihumi]|nr:nucleobase:cation symporter-2 family protein [Leekyejoonella antrihumi]
MMASRLKAFLPQVSGDDVHPVDAMLPPGRLAAIGLQHMLAAYAGIIAPPLIIGTALKLSFLDITFLISASLLASGIVTMLQTVGIWRIGVRLPLVQGVSFSGIASMIAIGKEHSNGIVAMNVIVGSVLVSSAIMFFLTPLYAKLIPVLFPRVVLGAVCTVIGLTLLPISIGWMQGTSGTPEYGSMRNIGIAILTLLLTVIIVHYVPGFTKRVGMLVAMLITTLISIPLGLTDFSKVGGAGAFAVPGFFHFGAPRFEPAAIVSMIIVMLVIMTEATTDMVVIGDMVDKKMTPRTVSDGLRADCLGSVFSSMLNGFQASAYGQNIGLITVSRTKSRFAVTASGVILVIMALFPPTAAIIAAIPLPVLGGAGVAIFGLVAVNGVQYLSKVDFLSDRGAANGLIVAATLTMGILPTAAPNFYVHFPQWVQTIFSSGIAAGAITAIILNLIVTGFHRGLSDSGISAAGTSPVDDGIGIPAVTDEPSAT